MSLGYWSVMTAILVVQANVGASLGLAFDRLMATLFGAALVALFGQNDPALMLALAVIGLACIATFRPTLQLAPMTAAIVILGAPHYGSPLASAANRVIEIGIGPIIAVVTALLLFPSRAGTALRVTSVGCCPCWASICPVPSTAASAPPAPTATYVVLNAQVRSGLSTGRLPH
jgi:uncharacterized membrane protein YgaE (UPF0421/DUF939 family)